MITTKTKLLAIALTIGSMNVSSAAKIPTPIQTFPFNDGESILTAQLIKLADSLYNNIVPGESLKLVLLNEDEQSLESLKRAQLTYARAEALLAHCYKSKYAATDFYAEMVPYTTPHTVKSNDIAHAKFKSFMSTKALTYFVFDVKPVKITGQSSLEFDSNTAKEKQDFTFNPKEEITANLVSGTKITFPANCLVYMDGHAPETDKINLHVAEYLEMDAIVMKSMTTSCHGKALQTGGMWNITAECNGKPLVVKSGMSYDIEVARTAAAKNMKVFTGKMTNGILDWTEEKDGTVTASTTTATKVVEPRKEITEVNDDITTEDNANLNRNLNNLNANTQTKNWNKKSNYRSKMYKPMNEEELKKYEEEQVQYQKDLYTLNLNDMGWINCDAFDPETQKLVDVLVRGDISDKSNVMLVFAKRKSVLPGYLSEDGKSVKFTNVAADEAAMIVIFEKTGDGEKIMKCTKMITPGNQKSVTVSTVSSTLAQLGVEIKSGLADFN